MIFRSLMRPEKFKSICEARKSEVVAKLKDIRVLQSFYKTENGSYANNFEQLRDFFNNGKITIVIKEGTAPDTLTETQALALNLIRRDTIILNAQDEIKKSLPDFDVHTFDIIPYSKGEQFQMTADTLWSETSVYVYEVIARKNQYLKDLDNDPRIKNIFLGKLLYNGLKEQFFGSDFQYKNNVTDIILGSLVEPSTKGNWE